MELLFLPSRGTPSRPLHQTSRRRGGGATIAQPAASSSNVEAIDTTAAAATPVGVANANSSQGWSAAGRPRPALGLGLNLSEDMRRGMMWRMLAPPAAAVAAEAAFIRLLDGAASDAPAWAGTAGSAVLFAAGLLGFHYGFLSSRWEAAERGSLVGWELAVRHWNILSMAKHSSMDDEEGDEEEDVDEEEDEEDEDSE